MSSAAEAELGALFLNAKQAAPMRQTLLKMEHPQPLMPIQTDNSTAFGMVTHKIIPKATKAMDMHFHWLHDYEQQQQFRYYCNRDQQILLIIGPSITWQPITNKCEKFSSPNKKHIHTQPTWEDDGKGMLNRTQTTTQMQ